MMSIYPLNGRTARRLKVILHKIDNGEYDRPEVTDAVIEGLLKDLANDAEKKTPDRPDPLRESANRPARDTDGLRPPGSDPEPVAVGGRDDGDLYKPLRLVEGGQGRSRDELCGTAGGLLIIYTLAAAMAFFAAVLYGITRFVVSHE